MSRSYDVVWATSAETDLNKIIDFIAIDNPANALKILKRIRDKSSELQCCPERGRIVPELLAQNIIHYRELLVHPWRIIYRIKNSLVTVLSMIDGRRNIEDILLDRFLNRNQ